MSPENVEIMFGSESSKPQEIIAGLDLDLAHYPYNQYRYYPSGEKGAWKKHFMRGFHQLLGNEEWTFYYRRGNQTPYLLGCRVSNWDHEHFGIKMANIAILLSGDDGNSCDIAADLLDHCIGRLKGNGVEFVSTLVCGSNLPAIHALESRGFRYYENIIWPVSTGKDAKLEGESCVRLMEENDLEAALRIAARDTYQLSHFHCDEKFDKRKVDLMHVKWLQTAWKGEKSIAVLDWDNEIAGYFIFDLDSALSESMGYQYARMQMMALDSNFRGKGIGTKLFSGTISLMKSMGADFIDSGYSSKNHISAKLHTNFGFYSVYEEARFHLWL